ncbi:MCE family protein [Actinophytocola algeriensis]|uniref:Virulence factor Mce-like protein n=1 Tax=Actinophytocola algeriensis TaxID=1768010 RepID=A0A7W7QD57_9PSEU|nr:MCE family protein [Actinophytocola algeriensis]MBB4911328.1 virulence factor Mce-like protein [Actinophytocola algeriensis]MBE1479267.1 virulence factor Mce-like protein [Actinophytocola algeriensis]
MTFASRFSRDLARGVSIAVVLALVVALFLWWLLVEGNQKRYSAVFTGVVGLYEANDVRILGVKVGHVDKVTPNGDTVRVDMLVDRTVRIPATAKAVIVSPSLVSDRYVQFTPVFTGGQAMAEGTVIGKERTATPLEVDDLYASLNRVSVTLGPNGVNKDGALADLLNTLAANADGNGAALNQTITQLSQMARTLSGSDEDLFATVDNLQKFTSALAANDAAVNEFSAQAADVTAFLADEREDLGAAVRQLGIALGAVQQFINDNRAHLKGNVDKLASITQVLVDQRAALSEVLDVAPLALSNIINSYNGSSGTLDARADLNDLAQPPIVTLCNLVRQGTPNDLPQVLADTCDQLKPLVEGLVPLPSAAEVLTALQNGTAPPLPIPGSIEGGN